VIYIEHRKNSISELANVNSKNGVEIDLRSNVNSPGQIHLSHDPWQLGDDFESWLQHYTAQNIHGLIILNTKEDSLEQRAVDLLNKYKLDNFIFLDTTFPTFTKWSKKGIADKFFLRVSKFEDLESVEKFSNSVRWLWIDCFDVEPISEEVILKAKKKFKLCMVSPELQGGDISDFPRFLNIAKHFDAICTKKYQEWRGLLGEI